MMPAMTANVTAIAATATTIPPTGAVGFVGHFDTVQFFIRGLTLRPLFVLSMGRPVVPCRSGPAGLRAAQLAAGPAATA
jgi:hypothetical protein